MSEPRIVSPQEAQAAKDSFAGHYHDGSIGFHLAHTVATEPDRTRAAVVAVLRRAATKHEWAIEEWADDIENGADW